jgi:hypothetical protein
LSTRDKLCALGVALHRKLLAVNQDIRVARAQRPIERQALGVLKASRRALDQAYSLCCTTAVVDDERLQLIVYHHCLKVYQVT